MNRKYSFALMMAVLVGCAADPGTQPHDMSQAQHNAMAQNEQQQSEAHAAQHDPAAETTTKSCGRGGCWTSVANPTKEHQDLAQRHRELAAKHRAAAAALAQTEAQYCAGLSDDDRDMSPFSHREDIASAGPLEEQTQLGKLVTKKLVGAKVVFRAVQGMTAEWLQRLVDCHVARASAVGHQMPEMDYCPLMLKGVSAKVSSEGGGFAVSVRAQDDATIQEVLRRAQALAPAPATAQ